MFKKIKHTKIKSASLLIIYIFSSIFSIQFHHHEVENSFFQVASSCEKAIYFDDSENNCHHKMHFSDEDEDCALCDSHTYSPQSLHFLQVNFQKFDFSIKYSEKVNQYHYFDLSILSNRGPPLVS